jgi:hypothetical protein
MKNLFTLVVCIAVGLTSIAQNTLPQQLPKTDPRLKNIEPKVVIQPADLTVSASNVRCRTEAGITTVTAMVSVYNSGGMGSGEIKLRGYIAPNAAMKPSTSKPTTRFYGDDGSLGGGWKATTNEPTLSGAGSRASSRLEVQFQFAAADAGTSKYVFFSILADYRNGTRESNETNNTMTPVSIVNQRTP